MPEHRVALLLYPSATMCAKLKRSLGASAGLKEVRDYLQGYRRNAPDISGNLVGGLSQSLRSAIWKLLGVLMMQPFTRSNPDSQSADTSTLQQF